MRCDQRKARLALGSVGCGACDLSYQDLQYNETDGECCTPDGGGRDRLNDLIHDASLRFRGRIKEDGAKIPVQTDHPDQAAEELEQYPDHATQDGDTARARDFGHSAVRLPQGD